MRVDRMGSRIVGGRMVEYHLLTDPCGEHLEQYGIEITAGGTSSIIRGICLSQRRILELLSLLIRNKVTPLGLRDVVDDWLLA